MLQEVQEEVRKVNKSDDGEKPNNTGVVIMTGVAKKNVDLKNKGELIEQNQDGLEVSYRVVFIDLSSPLLHTQSYGFSLEQLTPCSKFFSLNTI